MPCPGRSKLLARAARRAARRRGPGSERRRPRRTARAGGVKTLFPKGVAGAPDRVEEARLSAVFELLPQVADINRDHVVALRLILPDLLKQLLASQDLPRMPHEMLQELELGRSEGHRPLAPPRAPASGFQEQVGESQIVMRTRPPEQCTDPGQELLVSERLDEIVVGSGVEALDPLVGSAKRCEEQDGTLCGHGAQPPANLYRVKTGKHDVEHHEVERLLPRKAQG